MELMVRKGCATVIANVVRQIALTQIKSLRPIAIKINFANVISAGDSVLEDMIQICSNLNSLHYINTRGTDFVKFSCNVSSVLKASDLRNADLEVALNKSINSELIHVLNDNIPVTIYFRYANGVATRDDNVFFLEQNNVDTSDLVVINSRHTDIINFSYTITELDRDNDLINFSVESSISDDQEFLDGIVMQSIGIIHDILP